MKNKKIIIIAIITLIIVLIISNLFNKKTIDYSKHNYFTDISWERETDSDTEYLRFNSDGTVSYYCACGSPLNSNDLCDEYRYNEKNKTIKIKCSIKPQKTITKIKIQKYDENTLELNFNGEIRIFSKSK